MTGADVIEINREDDGEITMQKRLSLLFAAAAVALVLEDGNVLAWTRDPDMAVDAAKLAVSGLLLPAPEPTLAESLDTVVGTGDAFVGASDLTVDVSSDPPPGALFVDDDLLDCPNASFTSIQAAVDASGPNDTIKVCPGTYREQVRIIGHNHDGLKLESLKPLQAVIQWPTAETFPLALVYFNNADGVTIRGFTISGPFTFPACSPDRHEGVLVDNAFDERILHNHITLIRNSVPALYGCQEGDAVAIGRRTDETGGAGTTPGSARIEHNLIDEYQKNGVQAVNPGTVAHITHNVIRGSSAVQSIIASNGVVVFREAAATVDHNVISNNKFTPFPLSTGVILAEAPPGSSVSFNQIFDNDFGVQADTE